MIKRWLSAIGRRKGGRRGQGDGEEAAGPLHLSRKEVSIPVDKVRIGMRVTRLDRPWEETQFLFQGFEVTTLGQIRHLQDTCQHVYVDALSVTQQDLTGPHAITATGEPSVRYTDQRTVIEELPRGVQSYGELKQHFFEVLESVRKSDAIDVERVRPYVHSCVDSIVSNPSALFWLTRLKHRDFYTAEHSLRVCILAVSLGRELGFPREQLDALGLAALLHDVGKTRIPNAILNKPGPLTPAEMEVMKTHTTLGADLLALQQGISDTVVNVALLHHERMLGGGYPTGRPGPEIPRFARLVSIVDAYDAMTSERCYKPAMPSMDSLSILYKARHSVFDGEMVEAFIRLVGLYPPGSLVELNTGEVAIVISNNVSRLRPSIMIQLDANKHPVPHRTVNLSEAEHSDLTIVRSLPGNAHGLNLPRLIAEVGGLQGILN